jgi:hypothetical protein
MKSVIMLSVVMSSVIMLSVVVLSVITLSAVMLSDIIKSIVKLVSKCKVLLSYIFEAMGTGVSLYFS